MRAGPSCCGRGLQSGRRPGHQQQRQQQAAGQRWRQRQALGTAQEQGGQRREEEGVCSQPAVMRAAAAAASSAAGGLGGVTAGQAAATKRASRAAEGDTGGSRTASAAAPMAPVPQCKRLKDQRQPGNAAALHETSTVFGPGKTKMLRPCVPLVHALQTVAWICSHAEVLNSRQTCLSIWIFKKRLVPMLELGLQQSWCVRALESMPTIGGLVLQSCLSQLHEPIGTQTLWIAPHNELALFKLQNWWCVRGREFRVVYI